MSNADFDWRLAQFQNSTVVLIVDKDLGNRSVTNDIENVLADVLRQCPALDTYKILYRDSQGQWDEIRPIIREGRVTNTVFKCGPRGIVAAEVDRLFTEAGPPPEES